ncbi:MAG: family 16 glycosylhydrolase [Candidatus Eisenbacteria bacterium]|uniref:Family 16 glycosylhydrolase n=1 Tax=Eiseniibacteriota bacterium TaxID=2212470 RepID=A0A933SBM6_UNCEI|nr:family 16 glycosylhydrolase [Candidatus Eisenbacteria bacterium]
MKTPRSLLLLAVLAAFATLSAAPARAQYTLVWEDNFDGTTVNTSKWAFQTGTGCPTLCNWGNNELQYYRAENATVSGGLLTITARQQSFGGKSYTSARLRSQGLADFTYGKIEMRAKLPIGRGLWPAFWMLPTNSPYGNWPMSGEIDIMEYVGHQPSQVFGTLHYGNPNQIYSSTSTSLASGTFHDGFHTFAIEWEPNRIRWLLDGVQYACKSNWISSAAGYPAPFDKPFHMLINLAVGGNLPGSPDGSTVFPQEFVIDWVRVWQKPQDMTSILFDGMDHANPFANGWFVFNGGGGGSIAANSTLPPQDGCGASLEVGYGGPNGYIGGFGRTFPIDLSGRTNFEFWINPDANQRYTLEINLQEDDNGDNSTDEEFQYNLVVSPTGPGAIAGGGWQKVSIPLAGFFDDNSVFPGGNGVLDPISTLKGGNGQLVSVVMAIISQGGGNQTFRTDFWNFRNTTALDVAEDDAPGPRLLGAAAPNPFRSSTTLRFAVQKGERYAVTVHDLSGRRVRELESGRGLAGERTVSWDGRTDTGASAAPGVYLIRVRRDSGAEVRKIVLQR